MVHLRDMYTLSKEIALYFYDINHRKFSTYEINQGIKDFMSMFLNDDLQHLINMIKEEQECSGINLNLLERIYNIGGIEHRE